MVLKPITATFVTLVYSQEAPPPFSTRIKSQPHFGSPTLLIPSLVMLQRLQEHMDSGEAWSQNPPLPRYKCLLLCRRYDLDNHPSGASYTGSVCPNKETFGVFVDNTAHTCNEFGLRIWETYLPYVS